MLPPGGQKENDSNPLPCPSPAPASGFWAGLSHPLLGQLQAWQTSASALPKGHPTGAGRAPPCSPKVRVTRTGELGSCPLLCSSTWKTVQVPRPAEQVWAKVSAQLRVVREGRWLPLQGRGLTCFNESWLRGNQSRDQLSVSITCCMTPPECGGLKQLPVHCSQL